MRLDGLLDHNSLPKKGYLNKTDRERKRGGEFAALHRQHPAVESAINNLGHRGLDRVRALGADGFARMAALSAVALNIHRIGPLLRRKARRRTRRHQDTASLITCPERERLPVCCCRNGPQNHGSEGGNPAI